MYSQQVATHRRLGCFLYIVGQKSVFPAQYIEHSIALCSNQFKLHANVTENKVEMFTFILMES